MGSGQAAKDALNVEIEMKIVIGKTLEHEEQTVHLGLGDSLFDVNEEGK